ncbi:PadR family transcriptional regulator [Christensenella timonensis]|uniref:PadR family transcriptional regulator n=1 Tax=Christensenella timonensis TaxID=1816678 RepID=UPI000832151D|nr:PadR family transcriptional regulator [Christensenella timonensis]
MEVKNIKKRYIPMSETMFFILFSLRGERHGYGIMQDVEKLTNGRIVLGAGTIYQSISKLVRDGLIVATQEVDRQKKYTITESGLAILKEEAARIREMAKIAEVLS